MGISVQLLDVLKYSGSLATAVYGIYATVTDFKEKRDGKQVLSRKGYFGIALLIFASILTFSTDVLHDYQDHQDQIAQTAKANQDKADIVAFYENNKMQMQQVQDETQKALDAATNAARASSPLTGMTVAYSIRVPIDSPQLAGYRDRLEKSLADFKSGVRIDGVNPSGFANGQVQEVMIDRKSSLFPNQSTEALAYFLFSNPNIELYFHHSPVAPDDSTRNPDWAIDLSNRWSNGASYLRYNLKAKTLVIVTAGVSKYRNIANTGKILGVPDLAGSQMVILLEAVFPANVAQSDISAIRTNYEMESLTLSLPNGRNFPITSKILQKHSMPSGYPIFLATFPPDIR